MSISTHFHAHAEHNLCSSIIKDDTFYSRLALYSKSLGFSQYHKQFPSLIIKLKRRVFIGDSDSSTQKQTRNNMYCEIVSATCVWIALATHIKVWQAPALSKRSTYLAQSWNVSSATLTHACCNALRTIQTYQNAMVKITKHRVFLLRYTGIIRFWNCFRSMQDDGISKSLLTE